MSQQINLYNPALYPKKELLTPGFMVTMGLLLILLLGSYAGYVQQQTSQLLRQRDDLLAQVKQEQDKMVQMSQQYPPLKPSKALQDEITATEDKVHQRQKILEVLKGGGLGGNKGFSGLMQAFARQNVNGLWLVGFSANSTGDQMRINGRALTPDMIPEYLRKLSAEQSLRGREFTSLQVTQPKQVAVVSTTSAQSKSTTPVKQNYVEFALSAEKAEGRSPEKTSVPATTKTVNALMAETKS